MSEKISNEPATNLFGIFVGNASRLIAFKGIFVAAKENEQDEANKVWKDFLESYNAIVTEFAENLREAIIESGEYEELPNGKFLRKPDILDDDELD